MQSLPPELPCSDLALLEALEREKARRASHNRLTDYRPYPKQAQFHAAGRDYRERLLMAGNQLGKTLAAGMETAMHLTGEYPPGWEGRYFDKPIVGWAAGVTGESTRDNPQRILLGRPGAWGTGSIPKDRILDTSSSRGLADAVDTIRVRHAKGEVSTIQLKSYEKGREKWQGETLDTVWFDEEPPQDIYTEGLTRTNSTGGMTYITFTPLLGMTGVVKRFILDKIQGTHVTQMNIDDAYHYTAAQRAAIIASYAPFERDARIKGIPQLGSGRVFPVNQDDISCEAFAIPAHWPQLIGLDFGWDHPTAAARMAWDRDNDVIYVTAVNRMREQTPVMFAATIKPWGAWIPCAWPHDGLQHDKGSGEQLAAQYKAQGLNLMPVRAQYEDGTSGVEAGIAEMLDRMQTGRLQVFGHLASWFEEFNLYHRKEGLIVKLGDLMSATRYGIMMKRFALIQAPKTTKHVPRDVGIERARHDGLGWMG
jgi:phage terminase large subunit-like protein